MEKEKFLLQNLVPEEETQRIFDKVFDKTAIETLHYLAHKGYFNKVEFVISTGKEAHVFRAVDASENFRAVKIYKIETSDFNNMAKYLEGDMRFKKTKQNKRSLVFSWTRKEFRNLEALNTAGIPVPLPIASKNNVLVMEFIGNNGEAAKTIKENPVEIEKFFDFAVDSLAKMLFRAELVHSDFSEYNVLNNRGKPILIDCGQAVLTSHPNARDFWQRDLKNIANYLSKNGLKKTSAEIEEKVREKKNNL
jgi:RIO kinase 1